MPVWLKSKVKDEAATPTKYEMAINLKLKDAQHYSYAVAAYYRQPRLAIRKNI